MRSMTASRRMYRNAAVGVVVLQALVRRHAVRRASSRDACERKARYAAMRLQSMWRGFVGRRCADSLRKKLVRDTSVTVLQLAWLGKFSRDLYRVRVDAWKESLYRMQCVCAAATRIQAAYRAHCVRTSSQREKGRRSVGRTCIVSAAVVLQRCWRGHAGRTQHRGEGILVREAVKEAAAEQAGAKRELGERICGNAVTTSQAAARRPTLSLTVSALDAGPCLDDTLVVSHDLGSACSGATGHHKASGMALSCTDAHVIHSMYFSSDLQHGFHAR